MSYTRNFEVRRAHGTLLRDGSLKTAVSTSLRLGTWVELDPSNVTQVKQSGSGAFRTAVEGVLWFEHIQYQGVDPNLVLYVDRDTAPASSYVQVLSGRGLKLSYTNTPAVTYPDGRTHASVTIFTAASIAVGDYLAIASGGILAKGSASASGPAATDVARCVSIDTSVSGNEKMVVELL